MAWLVEEQWDPVGMEVASAQGLAADKPGGEAPLPHFN
jgi:hypothetical protein